MASLAYNAQQLPFCAYSLALESRDARFLDKMLTWSLWTGKYMGGEPMTFKLESLIDQFPPFGSHWRWRTFTLSCQSLQQSQLAQIMHILLVALAYGCFIYSQALQALLNFIVVHLVPENLRKPERRSRRSLRRMRGSLSSSRPMSWTNRQLTRSPRALKTHQMKSVQLNKVRFLTIFCKDRVMRLWGTV